MRLSHTGSYRADTTFGYELHRNPRPRIRVLQIEDQLREVFDRVDVVVRWRRDQTHARRGVPHFRDPRVDLVPGKLTALARLGALRHLDLQLVGIDQILAGDTEASRRDLLDRAALRVAVRHGQEALRILTALARVGAAAEAI